MLWVRASAGALDLKADDFVLPNRRLHSIGIQGIWGIFGPNLGFLQWAK